MTTNPPRTGKLTAEDFLPRDNFEPVLHRGGAFKDPAIGQGRPGSTAWDIADAFALSLLVGILSALFFPPVRGWLRAAVEWLT